MEKSTLDINSLILNDNGLNSITLAAVGSDTLDFEGIAGADITVTGIDQIGTSPNINLNSGSNTITVNSSQATINASQTVINASQTDINSSLTNINTFPVVGRQILYAYDSIGNDQITTTPQTLVTDTVVFNDVYTIVSGVVTIADIGVYEVSFTVAGDSDGLAGAIRGRMSGQIEIDTGGGFNVVPGSLTVAYQREQGAGNVGISVTKTIPVDITVANTDLRITYFQNNSTSWETLANASTLYIKRLS